MPDREFQVQLLETFPQWDSGLGVLLNVDAQGLSLFATPSFEKSLHGSGTGGDIVTDECGQTWWIGFDAGTSDWTLFRNDPRTKETERIIQLHHVNVKPEKLWLTREYFLIFDRANRRILGLSRENYQIVFEIQTRDAALIDIDFDRVSTFHALVRRGEQYLLCRLPMPPGYPSEADCTPLKDSVKAVKIAVSPQGWIYVLDTGLGRFLRLRSRDETPEQLAAGSEHILKHFKASVFEIDARGVLFLASTAPARLFQFADDGSHIGDTTLPSGADAITGIGFDESNGVYIATNRGLAQFTLSLTPVGQSGVYYARALDNGQAEGLWHRFEFRGSLPPNTSVEVFYHASQDTALKAAHDQVLDSTASDEEKQERIEALLAPLWSLPEVFRGSAAENDATLPPSGSVYDMLFTLKSGSDRRGGNKGRFLYLKLSLTTFDQRNRPAVRCARIVYPRRSYLRYLPPVYSEDAIGAAFLDRFLSLFETIFQGIEQEITGLFRYFDPRTAPREFLPWIASWINLAIDEDVPQARIQSLIRRAPELFARKGTPSALTEFLEIYTGHRVLLTEHSRMIRPLVIGREIRLGFRTTLISSGKNVFRVGDTSVLGHAILRSEAPAPEEAFLPFIRRFSILFDMDRDEFIRRAETLQRIVDEQKPAHTICSLGVSSIHSRVGRAQLEVNSTVTELQPYRLGVSPLGEASAIAKGPPSPRMERGARYDGKGRI